MDPNYQPNNAQPNPITPEPSETPPDSNGQPDNSFGGFSGESINQPTPSPLAVNEGGQTINSTPVNQVVPPANPQPTATIFNPSAAPIGGPAPAAGTSKKKLVIVIAGISTLLIVLVLLVIFGWYLPNRPSQVWKSSLDRSGEALSKIVAESTTKESLESVQKSESSITGEVKSDKNSYSGSLIIKSDTKNTQGDAKISMKSTGKPAKNMTMNFRSNVNPADLLPSIYFRLSGIQSVLGSSAGSLVAYDNKWISVEPSDFKELGITPESISKEKEKELTPEDIEEISKIITEATSEYVLTSDTKKGIITQKEYLGKEKLGDISTYKYSIEINKENTRIACESLVEKITKSNAYKKIAGESAGELTAEDTKKECADLANGITNKDPVELWVDRKTKLIHKIRFTSGDEAGEWVEVSQNYKGGDTVNLNVKYNNEKDKTITTGQFTVNMKTQTATGVIEGKIENSTEPMTYKLTMSSKPFSGTVDSKKPADAIPLTQVMNSFMSSSRR